MERSPALLLEGMALAGYAVGAAHGFVLMRSEYPLSKPALEAAAAEARAEACSGDIRQRLRVRRDGRRGRRLLRRRRGDGPARLPAGAARDGLRAPAVPRPARRSTGGRPSSTTSRRSATCRSSRRAAPTPTARAQPGGDTAARSSSASTSASRGRASTRCRSACRCASCARSWPAACATGARSRRCRSAARSAGSCRRTLLDTPFDFDALAAEGCMLGHGGILAFDDRDRHARRRPPPAALRRARELRQVLPLPDRAAARARDVRRRRAGRPRARWRSCWRRSRSASLCAHGGGMPAPIRSLLEHFPEELGLA